MEIPVGRGFLDFACPPLGCERRQVNPLQVVIAGEVRVRTTDQDESSTDGLTGPDRGVGGYRCVLPGLYEPPTGRKHFQ